MFPSLFFIECKQMLKSIIYYMFIVCLFLFFQSQAGDFTPIDKPVPNSGNYGYKYSNDENIIMQSTMEMLCREYSQNSYGTYPIGFYKRVILNEKKQEKMDKILAEVTGLPEEEIKERTYKYINAQSVNYNDNNGENIEDIFLEIKVSSEMTYERFQELMKETDKILGGGSSYKPSRIKFNAREARTYEEALEEYNLILKEDKVSRAYARLFCDYMGIALGILPVFIAVTRILRDKRAKANEVIYSKKCSGFVILLSRYLSIVLMIVLPVLILGISYTLKSIYIAESVGATPDYMAFVNYIVGWLLPTIMAVVSVGIFVTVLMDDALAIIIQGIWWFISLFSGLSSGLLGNYGLNLLPRFNDLGETTLFKDQFMSLVFNRCFYIGFSVVLFILSVFVYEKKRKGALLRNGKSDKHREG